MILEPQKVSVESELIPLSDANFSMRWDISLVPWFELGNSPREFTDVSSKLLLMSTTNGTKCIRKLTQLVSGPVFIGCLLNAKAVAERLFESWKRSKGEIWIGCAGSKGHEAEEDTLTGGLIIRYLLHYASNNNISVVLDEASKYALDTFNTYSSSSTCAPIPTCLPIPPQTHLSELGDTGLRDVEYCFGVLDVKIGELGTVGVVDEEGRVVRS